MAVHAEIAVRNGIKGVLHVLCPILCMFLLLLLLRMLIYTALCRFHGHPDGQDAGCYHGKWGSMGLAGVLCLFALLLIIVKSTAMYAVSLIPLRW